MEETMEPSKGKDNRSSLLVFLEALKKISEDLQSNYPIFFMANDPLTSMETILELESEANTLLSTNDHDPNVFKLSQLLCNLKSLLEKLKNYQGYSPKSLLFWQITKYQIYQVAFSMEAEIQVCIDKECVQVLVRSLHEEGGYDEDEKVRALKGFEKRLSQGFDRDFQELILRGKIFPILESLLVDSTFSLRVREHVALVIVALVRFNRDVFVGMVLMGPIVQALISMASCCSIQVVCSLVQLIKTPLVDEMELHGEIPRILTIFFTSEDLSIKVATMDCICEMAYFVRIQVIEAMLEKGLIEKLVDLERSVHGGDDLIEKNPSKEKKDGAFDDEGVKLSLKMEDEEENRPFGSCVARFAVQVEVGGGLSEEEKKEIKGEILRRIRESSVSEAEAATIIAEVLWGSSP